MPKEARQNPNELINGMLAICRFSLVTSRPHTVSQSLDDWLGGCLCRDGHFAVSFQVCLGLKADRFSVFCRESTELLTSMLSSARLSTGNPFSDETTLGDHFSFVQLCLLLHLFPGTVFIKVQQNPGRAAREAEKAGGQLLLSGTFLSDLQKESSSGCDEADLQGKLSKLLWFCLVLPDFIWEDLLLR